MKIVVLAVVMKKYNLLKKYKKLKMKFLNWDQNQTKGVVKVRLNIKIIVMTLHLLQHQKKVNKI